MTENTVASTLALVPWMEKVEPAVLAPLAQHSRVAQVRAGTVIVHRGQALQELCVIGGGTVASSLTNAAGKRLVVANYERGQAFGLNPVLDKKPAVYDSESTAPCTLIWIPRQALLDAMQASREMMLGVVLEICARSRDMLSIINDRSLASGTVRVGRLLLMLARRSLSEGATPDTPSVKITQSVLADMLGISRPHVNVEMRELERLQLVKTHYGTIELVDVAGLERLIAAEN